MTKKTPNFMLNILKVMGNSTPIYIHWAFSSNLHVAHVHPCVPMCGPCPPMCEL